MDVELPLFPTNAPEIFRHPARTRALFAPVLDQLAEVVSVPDSQLGLATPCAGFTVAGLRQHVLGWLGFFAAALDDPDRSSPRPDPETWSPAPEDLPAETVRRAAATIAAAIDAGVADRVVVMSQARMAGDGVLAMALGEYLVHGWDLAVATGRPWSADEDAAEAARAFLETTVAPEYRGEDSGFFGEELPAPASATPFERLLCFAGRDPAWSPAYRPPC